jgi:ATP/maltotriose-dependent transcriptional regulator MalT
MDLERGGATGPPRLTLPITVTTTSDSPVELAPGPFIPAALPVPSGDPAEAPASTDAAGAVGHVLAAAAAARGRMAWGRAETHAREAADLAGRAGLPSLAAAALNELAAVRLSQGTIDGVEALCDRAGGLAAGGPEHGRAVINLSVAAALTGRLSDAAELLHRAAEIIAEDDRWGRQLIRLNAAAVQLAAGNLAVAAELAAEALRAGRREKEDQWSALASLVAASVFRARGARNAARSRLVEASRVFVRGGDSLRAIQSHYLLGEIAYEAEDPIRAGSHYRDGLSIARRVGAPEAIELLTLRFEHR